RYTLDRDWDVEWEIWNEPDHENSWTGTKEQYFEAYRRLVNVIKATNPRARCCGPNLTRWNPGYITDFLRFARSNDVEPDVLSWHELRYDVYNVAAHIRAARTILRNEGYPEDLPIYINEYGIRTDMTNAGVAVAYFQQFEQERIDGAARACFKESNGSFGCGNVSMNNLLTLDHEPRSTWWAHKKYAEITGTLCTVTNSLSVYGVAGVDSDAGVCRMLLGRISESDPVVATIHNVNAIPVFADARTVEVEAERIPRSNTAALDSPVKVYRKHFTVESSSVTIDLPDFETKDAYFLTISPGSEVSTGRGAMRPGVHEHNKPGPVLRMHTSGVVKGSMSRTGGSVYDLLGQKLTRRLGSEALGIVVQAPSLAR
ncbi:MAG: hypothetical protein GF331_14980, partial [Chitinivibrionales bacterium]|nr:hypothetical protein [Chitinivibrionales bacterium]